MIGEPLPQGTRPVKMPSRLYCDTRLHGETRWILSPEPPDMQIPPDIQRCVAFIGYKKKLAKGSETVPAGTVFFVSHPIDRGEAGRRVAAYAVTAQHVIERIQERGLDAQPYIRVDSGEGPRWVEAGKAEWLCSDDSTIDIAIASISTDVLSRVHSTVPSSMIATSEILRREMIGPGHELFFPGLFVHHFGEKANLPIVRFGSIAAMPSERIKTKWNSVHGYLVEARSIGGLSGSPVFVQAGPWRQIDTHVFQPGNIKYYLLGLVHGHYGMEESELADVLEDDALSRSLNMGIAIVVPADNILGILDNPTFVNERHAMLETLRARGRADVD